MQSRLTVTALSGQDFTNRVNGNETTVLKPEAILKNSSVDDRNTSFDFSIRVWIGFAGLRFIRINRALAKLTVGYSD